MLMKFARSRSTLVFRLSQLQNCLPQCRQRCTTTTSFHCYGCQRQRTFAQQATSHHDVSLSESRSVHTGPALWKKKEISSEPIKFTTSAANVRSMPEPVDRNEYQGVIVAASLFVFLTYFLYLREENDLDEQLNVHLFDRVPGIEEPHLAQAIPRMKQLGLDTAEAEGRLKELVQERLKREEEEKKSTAK
ncbi:uncharacterized protein LOC101864244 [Aplysia californica]|uniref:Uncharacterized protein LOC101864244 n=1 Tax=Aplysia californica TaxID=6500 RepID=A0ABM0JYZ9_APLCA|nr:uncharacterized protein LOC101864244 [Aplysia californica]